MSAEELKATVRRVVEGAYNRGDLKALDELYSDDLIYHRPPLRDIGGLEEFRQSVLDIRSAFSDIQLTVTRIILEGGIHAELWTFRATHTGQSAAMPIPLSLGGSRSPSLSARVALAVLVDACQRLSTTRGRWALARA